MLIDQSISKNSPRLLHSYRFDLASIMRQAWALVREARAEMVRPFDYDAEFAAARWNPIKIDALNERSQRRRRLDGLTTMSGALKHVWAAEEGLIADLLRPVVAMTALEARRLAAECSDDDVVRRRELALIVAEENVMQETV